MDVGRPFFDARATEAAAQLGLPDDPGELAESGGSECARLAAALVRVSLDTRLREKVAH